MIDRTLIQIILFLLLALSVQETKAQFFDGDTLELKIPGGEPRIKILPKYPGGTQKFLEDLHQAIYKELKGKIKETYVMISFAVNAEGFILYTRIIQSGGKKMDAALQASLKKMQRLVPASMNGTSIDTIISLTFHITKEFVQVATT